MMPAVVVAVLHGEDDVVEGDDGDYYERIMTGNNFAVLDDENDGWWELSVRLPETSLLARVLL